MIQKNNKEQILGRQLHQLSIAGAFKNIVLGGGNRNTSLTLAEVISLNPTMIPGKSYLELGPDAKDPIMSKRTVTWEHFKKFLSDQGFTPDDWIHLLPLIETAKGMKPDFSKLSKEKLVELDFQTVFELKTGYYGLYSEICLKIFNHHRFTIEELIGLTDYNFESFFSFQSKSKAKAFRGHLHKIQQKLKTYGLTEKDGPFMSIQFTNPMYYEDYVLDLVQNRGFVYSMAQTAVQLGIKAGWITID